MRDVLDDHYKRQADRALQMAERAVGEDTRAEWLRVAQGWLSLIEHSKPTPEQAFDDEARKRSDRPGLGRVVLMRLI